MSAAGIVCIGAGAAALIWALLGFLFGAYGGARAAESNARAIMIGAPVGLALVVAGVLILQAAA